jgi:hypothetical protein
MGMQTTSGATTRDRAHPVAMLQRAAKPPVDHPGRPAGTNDLAVTFEPHFTGGIAAQVSAFGLRQQRTQMQCRSALLNVEVHHHGGVLPVWAAGRLGIPSRFDQAHKRLGGGGQRGPLT